MSQGSWENMTFYDVLSEGCRHDVADKNLGDAPGDLFFMLKDKYLPYACLKYCKGAIGSAICRSDQNLFDCTNPESQGNLVVRKIEIEVWNQFGGYNLCNVLGGQDSCKYLCVGPGVSGKVGQEDVKQGGLMAPRPGRFQHRRDVDYWSYNIAGKMHGNWYSVEKKSEGKYWRNPRIVKSINADCQSEALQNLLEEKGQDCFQSCKTQGLGESSECHMTCLFDTALGKNSGKTANPTGGLSRDEMVQAWLKGFNSDDVSQGGCPACPESGHCPKPSARVLV